MGSQKWKPALSVNEELAGDEWVCVAMRRFRSWFRPGPHILIPVWCLFLHSCIYFSFFFKKYVNNMTLILLGSNSIRYTQSVWITRSLCLGVPLCEDVDQEDDHSGAVEDEVDPVDPLGPADELPSSGSVASVHIDTLLQLLQLLVDQQQHLRLSRLGDGLHLRKQDACQGCWRITAVNLMSLLCCPDQLLQSFQQVAHLPCTANEL